MTANMSRAPPRREPNPTDSTAARALLDERVVGESLPAPFYVDREWFDRDLDEIFAKRWIFVATEAEIAEPGDYLTVNLGRSSVIIARDDEQVVRAHHNVCRHRAPGCSPTTTAAPAPSSAPTIPGPTVWTAG